MTLNEVLLRRWDRAASAGVMHTNSNDTLRRRIPGDLGLVVQFNSNHIKNKRPVNKQLLESKTDKSYLIAKDREFNFTKAKYDEFLGGLRFPDADEQRLGCVQFVEIGDNEDHWNSEIAHFALVNLAPLMQGHMLFVPDLKSLQPQKMTKAFLRYAMNISHAMERNDFALGFNSAGAWSSVNHFHLHGYFFLQTDSGNFPIVAQSRELLFCAGGAIVKHLPNWKASCYVIEPESDTKNAVDVLQISWYLLEILQSREIPHNLIIVDLVVFIFPRQHQCENGVDLLPPDNATTMLTGRLRVAVAELAGLVIAGDETVYHHLTEEVYNTILLTELSLSTEEESVLEAEWKAKIR